MLKLFNINKKVAYLEQWHLSHLENTLLEISHIYLTSLPLFKIVSKLLLMDHHQLPCCVLCNLIRIMKSPSCNLQSSFSSCTINYQFPLIVAHLHSTFWGVLLAEVFPQCRLLSTNFHPSLKWWYQKFIQASLIESSVKDFFK